MKKIFLLLLSLTLLISCTTQQLQQTANTVLQGFMTPTDDEAAGGLKEALVQGLINGTGLLSKEDGFFKNDLVKIPWPSEAQFVLDAMNKIGMSGAADKVTLSLNRAAEKASGVAKDVFVEAVKQLTVKDALQIVLGGDGAATNYLKKTTTTVLTERFRPIIDNSLGQVNATKYWSDAIGIYNNIPFMQKKVNTDLTGFVTEKALDGIFKMVENEENKIRKDPLARGTALMKKVFGFADSKKNP
jgi:hypothetical protein